jgi:hypothetical protein
MSSTATIATSLAIGGATIGSNALAVTGTSAFGGATTTTVSGNVLGMRVKNATVTADWYPDSTSTIGLNWGTSTNHPITIFTNNATKFVFDTSGNFRLGSTGLLGFNSGDYSTAIDTNISRQGAGVVQIGTTAANALGSLAFVGAVMSGKATTYNGIVTEGNGLPSIVKSTRITAQSAAGTIATYTNPASDASYEVSANLNVSAATSLVTTITCAYTDETNTARTLVMPITALDGNFTTNGAITASAAAVFHTPVLHIRCKASTSITISTTAGTFTGVTFTAEAQIKLIK